MNCEQILHGLCVIRWGFPFQQTYLCELTQVKAREDQIEESMALEVRLKIWDRNLRKEELWRGIVKNLATLSQVGQ